jgi:hypothetical protein
VTLFRGGPIQGKLRGGWITGRAGICLAAGCRVRRYSRPARRAGSCHRLRRTGGGSRLGPHPGRKERKLSCASLPNSWLTGVSRRHGTPLSPNPPRRCRVFGCSGIRNEISLAAMILPAPGETKRVGPRVFRMVYLPLAPGPPARYLQCAALNRSLNHQQEEPVPTFAPKRTGLLTKKPRHFRGDPKMAGLPDVVGPTGIEPMTSTV